MIGLTGLPKVMHLVISLRTGGLERFVIDLVQAQAQDCEPIVVCLEQGGGLIDQCPAETIVLDLSPGLHLGAVLDIARIAREKKIQVIHTHNEKAQFYGGLAGLLARVPVVHTKHGKNSTDKRSLIRNNLNARLCKKIITVSKDAGEQCVCDEKIPESKVIIVLNGVDTARFSSRHERGNVKASLGIAPEELVIGHVARMAPVKDQGLLLSACGLLKEQGVHFRLLLVGDGPSRAELERLAHSLGIKGQVIFAGVRHDISNLMQAMDVFVLSSLSEGISLTIVEAMACELPVIATAVGGNPEVVLNGETGYLVQTGDARGLSLRIAELLLDPQLRARFGRNGRIRVESQFSLTRATDQYARVYKDVLGVL